VAATYPGSGFELYIDMMEFMRIIDVDDSEFMRIAYRRIFDTQPQVEVVGMAENGAEAVELAADLEPDFAVLDIRMPELNGIDAAKRIVAERPGTGIVIISAYDDEEYIRELVKDGAEGKAYLPKTSVDEIDELISTVQAVAAGKTVLDPHIVRRLMRSDPDMAEILRAYDEQGSPDPTPR
jgi:DNA-binding NarL/FixJ family response regulator